MGGEEKEGGCEGERERLTRRYYALARPPQSAAFQILAAIWSILLIFPLANVNHWTPRILYAWPVEFEYAALAHHDGNRVSLRDHALDRGLLALQLSVVLPRSGNHVIAAAPVSVNRPKSADV